MEKRSNIKTSGNGVMQFANKGEEKSGVGVIKLSPSLKDINIVVV